MESKCVTRRSQNLRNHMSVGGKTSRLVPGTATTIHHPARIRTLRSYSFYDNLVAIRNELRLYVEQANAGQNRYLVLNLIIQSREWIAALLGNYDIPW